MSKERLAVELELWAREAQAELALFDWSPLELAEVQEVVEWLTGQDWATVDQDELESMRARCLQLAGNGWLALGPSQSPALNLLIWTLDNPDCGRQAEAVASIECILQQAREQGWDRSDESAFAELSEKLDACLMALLTSSSPAEEVIDRLVQLLDRTTYADVTGPTSSRCWNSWIRLLEWAPLEELSEPLDRLDADVEAFARAVACEPLMVEYRRLSRAFRAHRASAAREDWVAEFESILLELNHLARSGANRVRQLCRDFQLGAVTAAEYRQGVQELRQSLNQLARPLARRGQEAPALAAASVDMNAGLDRLEQVDQPTQAGDMQWSCETIERGLERLQAHG